MPIPDHGGFATAFEISEATATALVRSTVAVPPQTGSVNTPQIQGTYRVTAAVTAVDFSLGEGVGLTVDLAGSTFEVNSVSNFPGPIPASFRTVRLEGTVAVTDTLQTTGRSVVIDFTPSGSLPGVAPNVDADALFAQPLPQLILAGAYIQGGETAYWATRSAILDTVQQLVRDGVALALRSNPVNTLFTAPPSFPIPGTPVVIPVTRVAVRTLSQSLKILLELGGPPGNPAAITRSRLLSSTSTGVPVDTAAFLLSSSGLLGDILRPVAISVLGLPPGGFVPGVPFVFVGRAPVPTPGIPIRAFITAMFAGIDESGRLTVMINLVATDPTGGLTVTASVTQVFGITAAVAGTTLTLAFTSLGPPVVRSDVSIAAWVYAAAFFTGGGAVFALVAVADAFAGALGLNGAISGLVAGIIPGLITVPLALPPGFPAVTVRATSANQPDATRTTVAVGAVTIAAPFRDHDVIVNLV